MGHDGQLAALCVLVLPPHEREGGVGHGEGELQVCSGPVHPHGRSGVGGPHPVSAFCHPDPYADEVVSKFPLQRSGGVWEGERPPRSHGRYAGVRGQGPPPQEEVVVEQQEGAAQGGVRQQSPPPPSPALWKVPKSTSAGSGR